VLGDLITICRICGTVHHRKCWNQRGGCGAYSCAPSRREEIEEPDKVLKITSSDLEVARPLPAARRVEPAFSTAHASPAMAPERPARTNRLAIASLVCGVVGIPIFGLITGLVAILLAALALQSIQRTSQRGLSMALIGLGLGIFDVVGWVVLLGVMLGGGSSLTDVRFDELPPDLNVIEQLDPALQRAMRANVLIESSGGLGTLGGKAIGSGVILQIRDGEALIVTNRHVVDHQGFGGGSSGGTDPAGLNPLEVKMLGQNDGTGRVVWLAPGEVDLALVRAKSSSAAQAASWQRGRPMKVGQQVFAIGNPYRLGWTHTQGVISQLRSQLAGMRQVQVIQTQASINPGNSGGGLYDQDGYLLGINTWTSDKRVSEGIGFAIALETLLELAPPALSIPEKTRHK
jgi:S1-C subfamily serine protease